MMQFLIFFELIPIIIIALVLIRSHHIKTSVDFDEKWATSKIKEEEESKYQLDNERKVLTMAYTRADDKTVFVDTSEETEEKKIKPEDIKTQILNKPQIYEANSIELIKEDEKNFDADLFKKWCKELFLCIKSGDEEALDIAKNSMTEELYDSMKFKAKEFESDGLSKKNDDIFIKDIKILDYGKSLTKETIKVALVTKMKEYIIDISTGKVIRGDNRYFISKNFVMTFYKKNETKSEGKLIRTCPNCGAKTNQTSFGKCEYCGTLIFPIRYNWTLQNIETI